MRVYGPLGDPRFTALFPAKKTDELSGEPHMSRRLVYAALFVTSVAISACSSVTAPSPDDTTGTCRGGFVLGSGKACEAEG